MGCDIHCYIEYKPADRDNWSCFGGNINPGRYYALFAKMAGVRCSERFKPIVKPRGFPKDASYTASDDYWLYVTDSKGPKFVSKEKAEEYIAYGCLWQDASKTHLSNPDWHSHSWLTLEEFSNVVKGVKNAIEYKAILAAMRSLGRRNCKTRLVFWFDS